MFKKLLVVLAARNHQNVIDFSLLFAKQLHACVIVTSSFRDNQEQQDTQAVLESVVEEAKERGVCIGVQSQPQHTKVVQILIAEHAPDCILIGGDQFSLRLFSTSHLPIVVIPSGKTWRAPLGLKHLVIHLESDIDILGQGHRLAEELKATASAVHMLELPSTPPKRSRAWMYVDREEVVAEFEEKREHLRHQGKDLVFKAHHTVPEVVTDVQETTSTGTLKVLENTARQQTTDLIVLDSTAQTMIERRLKKRLVKRLTHTWPVILFSKW